MLNAFQTSPLYRIANPRSIAFFGASNDASRMGSTMLAALDAMGYEGTVYPIHPHEERVLGHQTYHNILDVPESPELAVIVLPTDLVGQTLVHCGSKGVRHAIIVSGGFGETSAKGAERQEQLAEIARRYDIRILGPNCLGVTNPHHKLNPTPVTNAGPPGFVGLVSQSGSLLTQMYEYLNRLGLGFSTAFSVGNEADLDLVDCLEYLGACPHTKVIALYIEGIHRGRDFMAAARAIVPHKPIVALYVGGSETGRRAARAHTGAVSGPDELYDGMLRQCGVIRAHNLSELFDYCLALGHLPPVVGPRVVIQTHSGGPGATAADACGRAGLELPALTPQTVERLNPLIPRTASINNPVDITFSHKPMYEYSRIPDTLLQDENADMLLAYFLPPQDVLPQVLEHAELAAVETRRITAQNCRALINLKKKHHKPIVGFTYRSIGEQLAHTLLEHGIPIYNDPDRAAKAMAACLRYHQLRTRIQDDPSENKQAR